MKVLLYLISICLVIIAGYHNTYAFNASSTSFFIRQNIVPFAGGSPSNSFSTSTSFKTISAGGQTAVGTSTSSSFGVMGGFLRGLYVGPAPSYNQIHYHWRNDDGTESAATSKTSGIQDTDITSFPKSTTVRLRIEVSNEGGSILNYNSQQFRLEYGLKSTTCSAIASWVDVGAGGGDWDMSNSTFLTEGSDTTNIDAPIQGSAGGVGDENHNFLSPNGGVKDTSSQTSAIKISSADFIEIEYSIIALTSATDGGIYCFRVTDAGATSNYVYSKYPQVTISSGSTLTFTTDGFSESFSTITPGIVSATSSLLFVKTDNSTGFVVTVQRDDSVGTMSLGGVYIPDKTAWSAPGATTTIGNSTASTTEAQTLQFRVKQSGTDTPNYSSVWWGVSDTTSAALFAGFPTSAKTIINRSTTALSTTTSNVLYNINVPVTQPNGSYSGSITYTVTANP